MTGHLEVCVQIHECSSRLVDISLREMNCTGTLNQSCQNRNEVHLDVVLARGGNIVHLSIQLVVEQTVSWSEEVHTPKRDELQRLDVLFGLMLWNTEIVGRLANHVPFDGSQRVNHISSTGRDTTTFIRPGTVVGCHDMERLVGIGAKVLGASVNNGITSRAEVEQIGELNSEWGPAGNVVVQIRTGHDRISAEIHVFLCSREISPVTAAPVRVKNLISAQDTVIHPANDNCIEVNTILPRLPHQGASSRS